MFERGSRDRIEGLTESVVGDDVDRESTERIMHVDSLRMLVSANMIVQLCDKLIDLGLVGHRRS